MLATKDLYTSVLNSENDRPTLRPLRNPMRASRRLHFSDILSEGTQPHAAASASVEFRRHITQKSCFSCAFICVSKRECAMNIGEEPGLWDTELERPTR